MPSWSCIEKFYTFFGPWILVLWTSFKDKEVWGVQSKHPFLIFNFILFQRSCYPTYKQTMAWWPDKKVYLSNVLNKLVPMVWHVIKSFHIITGGDIHDVKRKRITTWNVAWITSCDVRHDFMWHGIIIIIIIIILLLLKMIF